MKKWIIALTACALGTVCAVHVARADAPSSRYSLFATTVLDNETGLTWERRVHVDGDQDAQVDWSNARQYCSALNLGGFGWRVPTAKELLTLVDPRAISPAIDETAFPGTASAFFWSASPFAESEGMAWSVSFDDGGIDYESVALHRRVRCVR